jgi:hypothetical protein
MLTALIVSHVKAPQVVHSRVVLKDLFVVPMTCVKLIAMAEGNVSARIREDHVVQMENAIFLVIRWVVVDLVHRVLLR